jgi:hypothetical protein
MSILSSQHVASFFYLSSSSLTPWTGNFSSFVIHFALVAGAAKLRRAARQSALQVGVPSRKSLPETKDKDFLS